MARYIHQTLMLDTMHGTNETMKKINSKFIEILSVVSFFTIVAIYIYNPEFLMYLYEGSHSSVMRQKPLEALNGQNLVWWDNIGDCGVGGGSRPAAGAARWIGRGVTGGIIDLEVLLSQSIGNDYMYEYLNPKISYSISGRNILSVTIPVTTKNGTYKITDVPLRETVGGLGNMGIEFKRKFGETNAGLMILTIGTPTGKYDHRREWESSGIINNMYVVPDLQTGNGLYSLSLGGQYSIDKNWGMILFGGSYTAGFAKIGDLFKSGRNWGATNDLFSDNRLQSNKDFFGYQETNRYYVLFHEPAPYEYANSNDFISDSIVYAAGMAAYGNKGDVTMTHRYYTQDANGNRTSERLTGDFYGDAINVFIAVGIVQETCVHSFAIDYSYKFREDWYVRNNEVNLTQKLTQYDYLGLVTNHYLTKVSRTNTTQLWNFSYGLEISSLNFPFFLAGTLTIDKAGAVQGCTGTIGLKGSFF
jgi:hypothetical protein